MSEFNSMEKMGSEHLTSRPLSSQATGTAGRSHHYAAEAPRVLARMPDLGTAEAEREAQLPSLAHAGRLLSSRVSVAILMGGLATLLLVALGSYVFFGNDKATNDTAGWQPQPPAPTAAEAPVWSGAATTNPSAYPTGTSVPSYGTSATTPNSTWPTTPTNTAWNPEVANRPTTPWRTETQPQTPSAWGTSNATQARVEPVPAWNTPTTAPTTPEPNLGWNNQAAPAQDHAASWNTPSQASSWSTPASSYGATNSPYPTVNPTSDPTANTAVQASAVESQPSYTAPADVNRPAGPMMPSASTSYNTGYQPNRSLPAYQNQYQPYVDTNRTAVVNGQNPADPYGNYSQNNAAAYRPEATTPQPTTTQPYNYGTNSPYTSQPTYQQAAPSNYRGTEAQPASATAYGATMGTSYPQAANYSQPSSYAQPANYPQPSSYNNYLPSYPTSQVNAYPTPGYPTTNSASATAAPASYVGGVTPTDPGTAQFQGTIETPSVRTTYDRTRSSLY